MAGIVSQDVVYQSREIAEALKRRMASEFKHPVTTNRTMISMRGVDRPRVDSTGRVRDLVKLLQTPPSPEKTFITVTDYLLRSDDLALLVMLAQAAFIDRRIMLVVMGLQEVTMKYGRLDATGNYVLRMEDVYREGGREEVERVTSLIEAYNLILWGVRTSSNFSSLTRILIEHLQYPTIQRQISDRFAPRFESGSIFIGEHGQRQQGRQPPTEGEEM